MKRVKGRPMLFPSVICLIFIKHQPSLYLMTALPGFSTRIGTVSAPVITSGILVTEHYTEICEFLNLFPGVRYVLGGPPTAPTYDMTGSYNVAWVTVVTLSIIMTAFLSYPYRGNHICTKG